MKTRIGFVSNSSSTSFVIDRDTVIAHSLDAEKVVNAIKLFVKTLKDLSDAFGKDDIPFEFDCYNVDNWLSIVPTTDESIQLVCSSETGCPAKVLEFIRTTFNASENFLS